MLSKISVLFLRSRKFCLLPSSIIVEPVPPGLKALISSTQIVLPPPIIFWIYFSVWEEWPVHLVDQRFEQLILHILWATNIQRKKKKKSNPQTLWTGKGNEIKWEGTLWKKELYISGNLTSHLEHILQRDFQTVLSNFPTAHGEIQGNFMFKFYPNICILLILSS